MLKKFMLVVVFLPLSPSAVAQVYLDLGGGLAVLQDSDLEEGAVTGELGIEIGGVFTIAGGYRFNDRFRADVEFGYQVNDVDNLTISFLGLSASANASGDVTTLSFMANGYFDVPFGNPELKPYIGAGIGFANVEADVTVLGVNSTSDDTAFAYQLSAGIRYKLGENVDLRAGYRMMGTAELDFDGTEADYLSHNFMVGITFY